MYNDVINIILTLDIITDKYYNHAHYIYILLYIGIWEHDINTIIM